MPADDVADAERALSASEVVADRAAVAAALDRMAGLVATATSGEAPILLAVMNGGMWPAVELSARLPCAHRFDYVHATRYRGALEGEALEWRTEPRLELTGRMVVVVDDILDAGETLAAVVEACRALGAARVLTAVLVEKRRARGPGAAVPDIVGLEVDDRYVFGCGMDYREFWRGLPEIRALPAGWR